MADNSKSETPEDVQIETTTPTTTTPSIPDSNSLKDEKTNQFDASEEREKIKKQATLLFLQGKRSVYIKDFQAAIAALSESCQLFSQIYPEQDDALADPYFYYGKALLEVGRSESEVLGEQMQEDGNDDDEDEDDDDGVDEEGDDAEENPEKINGDVKTNGVTSESCDEGVKNGEVPDSSTSGNDVPDGQGNEEAENEDINDLQLSWEYLELSKLIYQRKADTCKETAIKLAETYLCLGENGLESENYSTAISDIKQALELQKVHLPEVDRRIAETYYQLGIAYSLAQCHDEAIANFKLAIEQLNKKIASLEMRQKMGDKKTAEEEKDAFYTMDGEVKEIQTVIKEIEEKIKDMHECKNQVKAELLKQVVSGGSHSGACSSGAGQSSSGGPSSTSSTSPSSTIQATDISHLIKKKRKNDETDEANSEKKTKLE